jgi:glycosyltransferase involved in cell wall biosynthesis
MPSVAVVILTFNEEVHIERAIRSVESFAKSIHVIDSFSTDRTASICKAKGVEFLQNPFRNQADQFEWGMQHISTDSDWILRIDADEVIEQDLALQIQQALDTMPSDVVGATFDRKHIFQGRWIKHGGRYPLRLLRMFKRGHGKTEQRWMDEHIFVEGGRTIHIAGGFADHNLNDLSYFTSKHNSYATREAVAALDDEMHFLSGSVSEGKTSAQASMKRWAKRHIFGRLPYPVSASAYFLYRYIFQLGFLDGAAGVNYHVLQGFWYRFLVGAKKSELEQAIKGLTDHEAIRRRLAQLTGLDLN